MFYVYRFLDKKKNIIYVGKSKQDLEARFRGHLHLPDACYDLTYKIEYIECSTESDMSIKEIYYINKYWHDGNFFNILDTTDTPVSVDFKDKWKQYKGPLGAHFHHSVNYLKGYSSSKEVKYNKDGTISKRQPNKVAGISSFVEGFSPNEVDLIADYLVTALNNANNNNQEEIRLRNLVIFVLGVNIPHKSNDLFSMKYCDFFDETNCPKPLLLKLNRSYKDEVIKIPQRRIVREILSAYAKYCGLNYSNNANDTLFQTREHQTLSPKIWGHIIKETAKAVGIEKNIATETMRKTYGLNIFNLAGDKLNALVFLEKLWGSQQYGNLIAYLNLASDHIDYDYYFGDAFALGSVNLSKIKCLQPRDSILSSYESSGNRVETKQLPPNSQQKKVANKRQKSTADISSKAKDKIIKRKWTKEELEIIEKHLKQNIPIEILAEEYQLQQSIIKFWINTYKQETDGQLTFEQINEHKEHAPAIIEEKK